MDKCFVRLIFSRCYCSWARSSALRGEHRTTPRPSRPYQSSPLAPGIANYIIGSQSAGTCFALWFGGIHSDKKLGMEQVAKTAENCFYLRPFARIMLALAARREEQDALAQNLFRQLSQQYPDNALYAAEYAKAMAQPSLAPAAAR
jgi:hypothetical protein